MSERFKLQHINDLTDQEYMRLKKITDNGELITLGEVVDLLNEQQAKIDELEKNFDDIVKWATTIAIRNVELDEKIGRLQREN